MLDYKKIHYIGAGGIGISALARLTKLMGTDVSGSDIRSSVVVDTLVKFGCEIKIGHAASNVPEGTELIVHTEDVNESSPGFVELEEGQKRGIRTLKYSEALGEFMKGYEAVGVSGTNGKSTTTAILGLIMEAGNTDPMIVLGSRLSLKNESGQFKANARFGQGKIFVYEADEYHRHMLDTKPFSAIITNIEPDHLDYYKDLDDIMSAFRDYISSIPDTGVLVYNLDDKNVVAAAESAKCRKVSFSMNNHDADYRCGQVTIKNRLQVFQVFKKDQDLGEFQLSIPGAYNIMNALGAITMALELGVSVDAAKQALRDFAGIWRRFETVGKLGETVIVSDYAHHPTPVAGIIAAAKEFYPDQKIMLVFQPHQKHRTKALFNEFVDALQGIDEIILPEIYFVPGRESDDLKISSQDLVKAVKERGQACEFAADLDQAEKMIREKAADFALIICAGAGTIDSLARKLVA